MLRLSPLACTMLHDDEEEELALFERWQRNNKANAAETQGKTRVSLASKMVICKIALKERLLLLNSKQTNKEKPAACSFLRLSRARPGDIDLTSTSLLLPLLFSDESPTAVRPPASGGSIFSGTAQGQGRSFVALLLWWRERGEGPRRRGERVRVPRAAAGTVFSMRPTSPTVLAFD